MVFTSMGQTPVYKDMSLPLFANGYLAIMAMESNAVKDIMFRGIFRSSTIFRSSLGLYGILTCLYSGLHSTSTFEGSDRITSNSQSGLT